LQAGGGSAAAFPGLAVVAPILLGTDIAAVLALSVGSVYGFGYMDWI